MNYIQKNLFWAVLLVIVAGGVGLIALSSRSSDEIKTNDSQGFSALYVSRAENEKVTVVEYSDFQCPACLGMSQLLSNAKAEFGDEVSFEFRHFPLMAIHPNAMAVHRIAEAAQQQGQFAFVHDLLFANTADWSQAKDPSGLVYELIAASNAPINIDQLKDDAGSRQTSDAINADISEGGDMDVQGTPSLFINDKKLNIDSYDALRSAIQEALDTRETN